MRRQHLLPVATAAALSAISLTAVAATSPPLAWKTVKTGVVPKSVIVGGKVGGRDLAICRAPYRGSEHTGKVVNRKCVFSADGRPVAAAIFQVLVGRDSAVDWRKASGDSRPTSLFIAGRTRADGRMAPLAICRAEHQGGLHPGAYAAGSGACSFVAGGRERQSPHFELLVLAKSGAAKPASATDDLVLERQRSVVGADLRATAEMLEQIDMLARHDRLVLPAGSKVGILQIAEGLLEHTRLAESAAGRARNAVDVAEVQQQGQRLREVAARMLGVAYVFGQLQAMGKVPGGMTAQELKSMQRGIQSIIDIYKPAVSNGRPLTRMPGAKGPFVSTAEMTRTLEQSLRLDGTSAAELEKLRKTWAIDIRRVIGEITETQKRTLAAIARSGS